MVHFVVDAVEMLDVGCFDVNDRGSGNAQYPPRMMLALLVYRYATGRFSSREDSRSIIVGVIAGGGGAKTSAQRAATASRPSAAAE